MTAPGTRYERTDYDHMAKVRQVRDQLDRVDPLWAHKLIADRRLAQTDAPSQLGRERVRHG